MDTKYPSNSNLARVIKNTKTSEEINEDVQPVLKRGSVKKQGVFASFFDNLLDDLPDLGSHIMNDIVLPGIKESLFKTAYDTLLALFHYDEPSSGTSYSSISSINHQNETTYRVVGGRNKNRNNYDETRYFKNQNSSMQDTPQNDSMSPNKIIFTQKEDALLIRDKMLYYINKTGQISLTKFYMLVNMKEESNWATNFWGWKDLSTCRIIPVHSGYVLRLPNPEPLEVR